jgi:hypothetical protein
MKFHILEAILTQNALIHTLIIFKNCDLLLCFSRFLSSEIYTFIRITSTPAWDGTGAIPPNAPG